MHFCQAAIFFFEIWLDFSKLRKLWYQLRFEAEFMQFRNCEIKTDQSNQFSGQDSKEAIWTFSLFLWCICWLSYNTYTTPTHFPFDKMCCVPEVQDHWSFMSCTAGLIVWKSFLVLHRESLPMCVYLCCGWGYRM